MVGATVTDDEAPVFYESLNEVILKRSLITIAKRRWRRAAVITLGWLLNWILFGGMLLLFAVYCCVLLQCASGRRAERLPPHVALVGALPLRAAGALPHLLLVRRAVVVRRRVPRQRLRRDDRQRPAALFDMFFIVLFTLAKVHSGVDIGNAILVLASVCSSASLASSSAPGSSHFSRSCRGRATYRPRRSRRASPSGSPSDASGSFGWGSSPSSLRRRAPPYPPRPHPPALRPPPHPPRSVARPRRRHAPQPRRRRAAGGGARRGVVAVAAPRSGIVLLQAARGIGARKRVGRRLKIQRRRQEGDARAEARPDEATRLARRRRPQ